MNDAGGYGRFEGSGQQDVADYWLSKLYSALYLRKLHEKYLNSTQRAILLLFVLKFEVGLNQNEIV